MNRTILAILAVLVLIAGAVGIGVYAYNAGVAQGLVDSGRLVAPAPGAAPGTVPYPYYGYGPFFGRPFGFGFGFLGCLFPLLFFILLFALIRGLFWRGRWGWGPYGPRGNWSQGVPPPFEEWHRRAHESNVGQGTETQANPR